MKRVFATVGFSFVFSLLLLNRIFTLYAVYYLIAVTALFLLSLLIKRKAVFREISLICFSLMLSSVIYLGVTEISYKPVLHFKDKECEIEATVIDLPTISSGGNFSYLIKTKTINGEKKKIRMRLYTPYDICAEPYDEISFSAKTFIPGDNNKSTAEYFRSKRIYLAAYTKEDVTLYQPQSKPFISFFYLRKAKSEELIRKYLDGDYAEFAISLLFGDKTYLSEETKDNFSVSGVSHIMAVSGLHMSVWIFGLYFILKKLGFDNRVGGGLCILACICLVFFCAFSVSVVRAAIMLSVYFSASFFRRKGDSFNSLGLAAFLICAVNPFAVCDVSFLLSLFATLGILVFSDLFPLMKKRESSESIMKRIISAVLSAAFVSLSAAVFTLPVLIRYYSSLGIYSVLGNIAVFFAVAPCLLLSGVLSVCPPVELIVRIVASPLLIFEKYIFGAVKCVSSLPMSRIISQSDGFLLLLPLTVISAVYIFYCVRKKDITPVPTLCALSLIIITVS